MDGERGNLPGIIFLELREQRLALGAVEAANRFRNQSHLFQVTTGLQLLDEALLLLGASDGNAIEMLDGALARVGSFGGTDLVREMADERDVLFVRFVDQSEIRVAGYAVVDLDEISATSLDFVDDTAGVLRLVYHDRSGPHGRIAVNDGAANDDFGRHRSGGKLGAQLPVVPGAEHHAHAGNSVGDV